MGSDKLEWVPWICCHLLIGFVFLIASKGNIFIILAGVFELCVMGVLLPCIIAGASTNTKSPKKITHEKSEIKPPNLSSSYHSDKSIPTNNFDFEANPLLKELLIKTIIEYGVLKNRCLRCGRIIETGLRYCPYCGRYDRY